jgi:type IV pilus assembly protein PilW
MKAGARERGLSLVELMVGMAISLVIVAAALLSLTHHLRESRNLVTQARLMQDLNTASDLIARNLRRADTLSPSQGSVAFSFPNDSARMAYRLSDGVIEMKISDGHWQAMTDANTLRVASFTITPQTQDVVLDGSCSQPCVEGSTSCPPRQQLRSLSVLIEARATTDAALRRTASTTVRLRNNPITGECPA